jgi:hypothetical protein
LSSLKTMINEPAPPSHAGTRRRTGAKRSTKATGGSELRLH